MLQLAPGLGVVFYIKGRFYALISSLRISQIHSEGDNSNKGVHVVCLYYGEDRQVSMLACPAAFVYHDGVG